MFFFFFDENNEEEMNKVINENGLLAGNAGEWSEPYVLLRLLANEKIFAADENLNKIPEIYFPILKIVRQELSDKVKKTYNKIDFVVKTEKNIEIYFNDELIKTIPESIFEKQADYLLEEIQNKGKGNLSIKKSQYFLNSIGCNSLKASSQDKTDITLQLHDINTGYNPICGFSIKSQLGSASSLVNASEATNFIYEIKGLNEDLIYVINQIDTASKIQDRIRFIKDESTDFTFYKMNNQTYNNNLFYLDTTMPQLLAEALKYSYFMNETSCKTIIELLKKKNPLNYPEDGNYYEYKFKKFLCSAALGMMPSKPWNGKDEANGGYIIVRRDGEVLAYYIYNRDKFEDYLYNNTYFERGSTTKHKFATIYEEDGKAFIKLNLQIRFNQ